MPRSKNSFVLGLKSEQDRDGKSQGVRIRREI